MTARSAFIVRPGGYVVRGHELTRVRPGTYAIRCELCEWVVVVSSTIDRAERLRREHLGTAHLSSLTSGAAVLDPDLANLGR